MGQHWTDSLEPGTLAFAKLDWIDPYSSTEWIVRVDGVWHETSRVIQSRGWSGDGTGLHLVRFHRYADRSWAWLYEGQVLNPPPPARPPGWHAGPRRVLVSLAAP